jgi:hypothetical protein
METVLLAMLSLDNMEPMTAKRTKMQDAAEAQDNSFLASVMISHECGSTRPSGTGLDTFPWKLPTSPENPKPLN